MFAELRNVIDYRIEAEYYLKKFLSNDDILNSAATTQFSTVATIINGRPYRSETFGSDGEVRVAKIGDVTQKRDAESWEGVSLSEFSEQKGQYIRGYKLLMTLTGDPPDVGKVNLIDGRAGNLTWNQRVGKIAIRKEERLSVFTLYAVLSCEVCRVQLERYAKGIRQRNLGNESLARLKLPQISDELNTLLDTTVRKSIALHQQSTSAYAAASALLLRSLGMENFTPQTEAVAIKSLSESFSASGRLDAEYYQPYYYEFESRIKQHGFVLADDICSEINYGTVPTSPYTEDGTGVPYIKGMNVKNTLISGTLDRITNIENVSSKHYTQKGDIIISQMGTVADCGIVTSEQENWLFASFTIRLRLDKDSEFDPYFIGMYIQHLAKPYYFYRHIAQASVRQNTDLPTVKGLFIPKLPIETQVAIATQVQQSFALRRQSERLLEQAKRAVEIAIEDGEDMAMEMLNAAKIGGAAL
jgi:restriction endonuclease S subunit